MEIFRQRKVFFALRVTDIAFYAIFHIDRFCLSLLLQTEYNNRLRNFYIRSATCCHCIYSYKAYQSFEKEAHLFLSYFLMLRFKL